MSMADDANATRAEELNDEPAESPLPLRTRAAQIELTSTLLSLDTLAERLSHLIDNESFCYLRRGELVFDPEVIAEKPRGLKQKRIYPPKIASWVEQRTGTSSFSRTMIYNYAAGKARNLRAPVALALAAFWRIDARLLDPSVPASQLEDLLDDPNELDDLNRRTYELMNKIGFTGVRPREVETLGQDDVVHRRAFLEILQAIDRSRSSDQPPSS
ncbi:hypothetical protein CFP75_38345 [Amycolatopsis alba DSM 44262]|uniref:Uncharacterized protein n=2 Tax=Amycolatopsis alba TaxID=76020 RepID=A0A229R9V3_AMYAL|nr:hypothetical protein CFP75_38345 [Amycolatopsis alba DSM 44262]